MLTTSFKYVQLQISNILDIYTAFETQIWLGVTYLWKIILLQNKFSKHIELIITKGWTC